MHICTRHQKNTNETDENVKLIEKARLYSLFCIVNLFKLTSFKDYAVVGYFVPRLQAGAVPAVPSELVLALMDGNLDSLDCRSRHVWVPHAHL